MVKVKVIENFVLKDFASLKNIERANGSENKKGSLYSGDTFECDEKMADYLTGNNALNKKVVEIIEIKEEKIEVPEEVENQSEETIEEISEEKPKKKKNKKSKK